MSVATASPEETTTVDLDDASPTPDSGESTRLSGALRPVTVTEARERQRLEHTAGRSGPAALLVRLGLGLGYLGSAQAARNGLRYRPVAWTLIALVALSFYLPGRIDWSPAPEPWAAPNPVTVTPTVTTPDAGGAGESGSDDVALPPPVTTPIPSSPHAPSLPTAPTPPTTAPPVAPPETATTDVVLVPLTVRAYGWASLLPSAPLLNEVADDTAPVAMRLGEVDRVSYLRLSGVDDELELTEHADSAREALGPAGVAICPILEPDWAQEGGQSFDDGPQWDDRSCVGGVENDDRWTFDLSSFTSTGADPYAPVVGDAGFALVPTDDAPADFNIAFSMPTELTGGEG